jgi:hypothetical protein
MFGSLVVVFPTPHQGGALMFRHRGGEWTFDSATMVQTQKDSSIAFAAFYSDVEHEVTPVTSGHRVTLTYNLYFSTESDGPKLPIITAPSGTETAFDTALSKLLSDDTFLEEGGFLGFGLQHEYPLDPKDGIRNLINYLKGSDAIIHRVCSQHSLQTMLRVVYQDQGEFETPPFFMANNVIDYSRSGQVDGGIGEIMSYEGGRRVAVTGPIAKSTKKYKYAKPHDVEIDVNWVTDLTKLTVAETPYAAYGNEASLDYVSLYYLQAANF